MTRRTSRTTSAAKRTRCSIMLPLQLSCRALVPSQKNWSMRYPWAPCNSTASKPGDSPMRQRDQKRKSHLRSPLRSLLNTVARRVWRAPKASQRRPDLSVPLGSALRRQAKVAALSPPRGSASTTPFHAGKAAQNKLGTLESFFAASRSTTVRDD